MNLIVDDVIFEKWPKVVLGVAVCRGLNNAGENAEMIQALREVEGLVKNFMETPAREHPHILPWREAYRAFGSNPKDYPSSIENLVRRVQKGGVLPHINTLVDIYNALSLQYVVPMGGEDLDKIVGDVRLRIAGPSEPAALMLGDKEPKAPSPGEVLYADEAGAICRRWNWREADRTKLTEATRDCIIVVEGLPPLLAEDMRPIIEELAFRVRAACGGEVTTALVDTGRRTLAL